MLHCPQVTPKSRLSDGILVGVLVDMAVDATIVDMTVDTLVLF